MSLNIDANNINKINSKDSQSSIHTNLSSSSENVSVFQNNDEAIKQLCTQLQINEEQLKLLLDLYPDFYSFDPAKQAEIVQNNITSPSVNNETDKDVSTNAADNTNSSDSGSAENPEITEQPAFNHKEFSKLSAQEKLNVYALELAKNKFLYQDNNKKSIEDWNSLSEEERNNLVKNEFEALIKDKSNNLYDEKDINSYFNSKMTKLQTANYLEQNIDDFSKSDSRYISVSIHDYLFSQDKENLSKAQNAYIENQYVLSKAVIQACKDRGDTTYADGVDYNLTEDEIAAKFGKDGVLNSTTRVEVQMKYLQDKLDKGIQLNETEQAQYNRLNKLVNTLEGKAFLDAVKYKSSHPGEQVNYGRLDAFKKSEFGKDFEAAVNKEDKAFVVKAYLKKVSANLSPEEKAKLINELTIELMYDADNADAIVDIHSDAVENSDDKTQAVLAQTTASGLAELNAMNSDDYNEAGLLTLANTHEKLLEKEPKRAEMLASGTLNNISNKKLKSVSDVYSASKSENIQLKHADRALRLDIKDMADVEIQRTMLENVAENSSLRVRQNTGKRLDEAHKDNQLPLTGQFIKDKEVAKAMNEDGTFTRFHKDNKSDAFHMFKTRFEQNDFAKDEAVTQLNLLADNIKKVKEADIQLEMHNDIMTSKYSEVQEHAAGNIKDYDPTVQTEALGTVLASGNEKAIEAAAESVKYSPDCVKSEMAGVIEAYASDNAIQADNAIIEQFSDSISSKYNSIQEKIASGQILSDNELSLLSVSERRDYYASFFKKLPVDKKIKLLASMPDSQKKTVYTLIARTDSALFNAIIKDKDRAGQLLSMGLPEDVNTKIKGVVSFLAVSDIGYQNIAAKYDIEYDNNDAEAVNNRKYTTKPEDFDTKEIYKKDKKGNILA